MSQESRRPPWVSYKEPGEMDANAIHPGPEWITRMREAIPSPSRVTLDAMARLPLPSQTLLSVPSPSPFPIYTREAVDAPLDITPPHPNPPFDFPSLPFCPTLISPSGSLNQFRQEKMPLDIPGTTRPSPGPPPYWPFEVQQGDSPQLPRPHTPLGGEVFITVTPQSGGRNLIDFSFMSPVPSHIQWSSLAQHIRKM
ncbi:hypothetical protein SERLADRAFT_431682 [Serpula lacrymans var. lacrymans S7.9]|nr:uncharacterized protein SERLADRAFT_431682 [Serpula lacrymans var. lacrymans S7.9]EGO30211.1 hypothetical protein SERLADRAFT_431682 [Serpula lacrymans var. lacrymans S7.9]